MTKIFIRSLFFSLFVMLCSGTAAMAEQCCGPDPIVYPNGPDVDYCDSNGNHVICGTDASGHYSCQANEKCSNPASPTPIPDPTPTPEPFKGFASGVVTDYCDSSSGWRVQCGYDETGHYFCAANEKCTPVCTPSMTPTEYPTPVETPVYDYPTPECTPTQPPVVPEPASALLAVFGAGAMALRNRFRSKK